jgi:hypothetical protein
VYETQEQDLLHVATRRAMERLLVAPPTGRPSPFIADLDRNLWEQVVWK